LCSFIRRKLLTDSILSVGATDMNAAVEILHCAQEKSQAEELAIGIEWVESIKELLREAAEAAPREEVTIDIECEESIECPQAL
jgi:hypothetical protein